MTSRAEIVVRRFLQAPAQRDAAAAVAQLAPDAALAGAGGVRDHSIDALFATSRRCYQFVDKSIEGIDALGDGSSRTIGHCRGTLFGRWADGGAFEGIRFSDRFGLDGDLIIGQWVRNGVALYQPALPICTSSAAPDTKVSTH